VAAKELSVFESSPEQYFNQFVQSVALESFVIQTVDFSSGFQGLFSFYFSLSPSVFFFGNLN
jgi:hypothetical protein